MSLPPQLLAPLVIIFVVAIFAIFAGIQAQRARVAAWAEFASNHGMKAVELRIEGSYEGYPLTIEAQLRGSGRSRQMVAVLDLSTLNALPAEFSLEPEGLGNKVLHFFGKRDDEIGDENFDKRFALENLSPAMTSVLRHRPVQQHLYMMRSHYMKFRIRGGWIQAEYAPLPSTVEQLEEFLGPALMLVHTLEETSRRSQGWTTR